MKNKISIVLSILLVIVLIVSSIYLYIQYKEEREQENIFKELGNVVTNEKVEDNEESNNEIDVMKLYAENSDFMGWIKIEDTNISYPVMQTDNNRKDYYLRKNFYKEYSQLGTPYIAEYCNVLTSDNLIIYGHHISNYKMFGELEKYKKQNFYNEHKIINFNTIYENANYEIIAVFKTVAYSNKGFKYYNYYDFKNEDEFNTFINKCKELSFYNINETAEYGDKFITLSTCEYSNNNGRLVVIAKKLTTEQEE